MLLFGNPVSRRVIFSTDFGQSQKLIDVWQSFEPVPPVTPFLEDAASLETSALPVILLLFLWTVGLVWIYARVNTSIPGTGWRRGAFFGFGVWLSSFLFFETFTPLNLFGEPLAIIGYELALQMVVALVIGISVAATYRPYRS